MRSRFDMEFSFGMPWEEALRVFPKKKSMARRTRGFTLIEIMIVVVIIALLLLLTLPYMARQRYQAQLSGCENNERAIAAALETYHTKEGSYPAALDTTFYSAYMGKGTYGCPTTKQNYTLEVAPDGHDYTIVCNTGVHHLGLPGVINAGFPQFSPKSGLSRK